MKFYIDLIHVSAIRTMFSTTRTEIRTTLTNDQGKTLFFDSSQDAHNYGHKVLSEGSMFQVLPARASKYDGLIAQTKDRIDVLRAQLSDQDFKEYTRSINSRIDLLERRLRMLTR